MQRLQGGRQHAEARRLKHQVGRARHQNACRVGQVAAPDFTKTRAIDDPLVYYSQQEGQVGFPT